MENSFKKASSSNEKTIRELARQYLLDTYDGSVVKDEFGTFLNVRTDLLCINETQIISLEVKSDRDTFARLENQLDEYLGYSTGVYVALDEVHYEKYIEKYIEKNFKYRNVGILVYSDSPKKLELKRKINHYQKITMCYELLTSAELPEFFYYFKGKTSIPKNEETSKKIIETIFTYDEIYKISHSIFINRFKNTCGFDKELIIDFDYKHSLFKKWLEVDNWNFYIPKQFNWLPNKKKDAKAKRSSLKCLSKRKNCDNSR